MVPTIAILIDLLDRRHPGWFVQATRAEFVQAFAGAARRLGRAPLSLTPEERAALVAAGIDWPLDHWGLDELGRVCLLHAAGEQHVEEAFYSGDIRERQAVLKLLPLLPEPPRFVPLAVEACRTNIKDVFDSLALDNPFPGRYFPEPSFNQMVLKSLFIGSPLGRVLGLAGRVTPELLRMADDYAAERRAAGRAVPPDIELLRRLHDGRPR